MGAPPNWSGYIAVDDVDAAAEKVKRLGGTSTWPPPTSPPSAVSQSPVIRRAHLHAVQAAAADHATGGSGAGDARRRIGWHELYATDWETDFAFYSELFGWKKDQAMDMGPGVGTYQLFAAASGGPAIGGMFNKPAAVPVNFWLYYFNVDDIDAGVERVKSAGGKILMGPMDVPGGAFIVQCMDPQGAMFALTGPRK